MTIKQKLLLSSLLTAVMFTALGATLLIGYRYVTSQASIANSFDNQSKYLQMMLRGVNEIMVTEGTNPAIELAEEGLKGFDEIHSRLPLKIKGTSLNDIYAEQIDPKWNNIKENIKVFLDYDIDVESQEVMTNYGRVISQTDKLIMEVNNLSKSARSVVDSGSKKTQVVQYAILSGLLIALLFILYMSYRLYRTILSPIRELSNIAEGFGDGNFNIIMDDSGNDEFGQLAVHYNQATSKLSNFILSLKEEINTLNDSADELAQKSSRIASNTKEQSSQTTHAATAMEELSSSFVEVAKNASNAATSAREATDLAVNGGSVVSETIQGMNRIADSVKSSSATIGKLGDSSEKIGEIIKVINDIASQTNLLALNAAIEAARAGEQGRGFAVVADEVRKLAEKTTSSTNEIGDMIKNIQIEANKSVEAMETGTKNVESGVELANQAGEALSQIVEAVQQVTDMITPIAAAAEEQSTTGEEVASNIESVASITNNTASDAETSSAYSDQLSAMASDLKALAAEFKLRGNHNTGTESDAIQPENSPQSAENPG
jgi:methyl-accepting chemotaxis protein